jgi:hypothetical protein
MPPVWTALGISGFVKDPAGAVIVNAAVMVRNEATLQDTRVNTNENGYFQAPNLV